MEHCLVYFSSSTTPFDEQALSVILQQSRLNNARLGITGVLLYVRGSIIQVLEGEKQAVDALYERITRDPRHTRITCALSRPIASRQFGEWHMGYETITARQLAEIQSLVDLENSEAGATQPDESIILKTLRVFYESNRHN